MRIDSIRGPGQSVAKSGEWVETGPLLANFRCAASASAIRALQIAADIAYVLAEGCPYS